MAEHIFFYNFFRNSKTATNFLEYYAYISSLIDCQSNDTYPRVYIAGRKGPNPNIINHDAAMKAIDTDIF